MSERKIQRLARQGDPEKGLRTIGYSFPDAVIAGDPIEAAHVFYDWPLAQATVGIWESQAGAVRFDAYPFDEFCILVEGELSLIGSDGTAEAFRAGDLFIVPKDWSGTWVMHRPVRKYYVELKDR